MPKVLRIINRFNLGGPTYNVAYLTKFLDPEFETLLVGGSKEVTEESSLHILDQLKINPKIIPELQRSIDLKKDLKAYLKIKKIIKEFQPDIVHTHASKAGTIGRLAALSCNVPVIVHTFHGHVFHSYFGKLKTRFYKSTERFLAKRSSSIITISERQKHEICNIHKICDEAKTEVIKLGFDLNKFQEDIPEKRKSFREKYGIQDDEIAIGIIGRLVPIKNHALFLNALKTVIHTSEKKVKGVIIGDGEELKNILQVASDLKLEYSSPLKQNPTSDLVFTSWIKNIDWAMAGLDIISLTSLNEGTPVSLIEAQAAGKPIVSTNVGGIENIVIPNETALLCESEDEKTFAKHLINLVKNESLRINMSSQGWNYVRDLFHYKTLSSNMSTHYRNLLALHKR